MKKKMKESYCRNCGELFDPLYLLKVRQHETMSLVLIEGKTPYSIIATSLNNWLELFPQFSSFGIIPYEDSERLRNSIEVWFDSLWKSLNIRITQVPIPPDLLNGNSSIKEWRLLCSLYDRYKRRHNVCLEDVGEQVMKLRNAFIIVHNRLLKEKEEIYNESVIRRLIWIPSTSSFCQECRKRVIDNMFWINKFLWEKCGRLSKSTRNEIGKVIEL